MTDITHWTPRHNNYGDLTRARELVAKLLPSLTQPEHYFTESTVGPLGNWNAANNRWIQSLATAFREAGYKVFLAGKVCELECEVGSTAYEGRLIGTEVVRREMIVRKADGTEASA